MKIINLLPKEKQREFKFDAIFHSMVVVIWLTVFSCGLVVLAQIGIKLYLQDQLKNLDNSIAAVQQQNNKQDNAEIKNRVKVVNDAIVDYADLAKDSPKWSKLLRAFIEVPPEGVLVSSMSIDSKKQVTIRGYSPTREAVLEFQRNLESNPNFTNVANPFENIIKARDVSYTLIFTIKEDLLK